MLQAFRNMFKSKFGIAIALVFLGLIALAFASADVSNSSSSFGGVAGGDRVATVGTARVDTSTLRQAATSALENMKRENPTASMQAFLAQGGLERVLTELIDRTAIGEFGRKHGIVASARLIDSEIAKIASFRGPDGKFSETLFRQAIQQQGVSEALIRDDLSQGLVARQILVPAAFGAVAPRELAVRYAALLREHRKGEVALLPSTAFLPRTPPTVAELTAYYTKQRADFIRPERRVIRFATFGEETLSLIAPPSENEIAARFSVNKAQYAAVELRRITQLIVPTEDAAKAIIAEIAKGGSLESAAVAKGLTASNLGSVTRDDLARATTKGVADASFAAAAKAIASPARSGLGWHIMRIDGIEKQAGITLAEAQGEISALLSAEKRRTAINDLTARFEDEFDKGGNLSDAAKELGVQIQTTEAVIANGQVYGKPGQTAPALLTPVIATAFAMEQDNKPQLAELAAGKSFIIFDVSRIEPSAPAPLAEIQVDVMRALVFEKGATAARAAADKVVAQARNGGGLGAAMAALKLPLPPVDAIDLNREELAKMQRQVPKPIALMFSMAKGTVKLLRAPNNQGWFVVLLEDIVPGNVPANDPILISAQRELGQIAGREYGDALRRAIRAEVVVKRNDSGIRAVSNQLGGGN